MQIPLEIAFRNIESSGAAEDAIRDHVKRLERIFDRIITCRVWVDQRNQNANETIPPVVHIEISVPGHKDIVVAHEPDHLQRKYQAPDLRNAINEAFRIAERRLSKFKDKLTDHGVAERGHEAANELRGQIAELTPEQDFGYVMKACFTSTVTACSAAISTTCAVATQSLTWNRRAIPAPLRPRCGSSENKCRPEAADFKSGAGPSLCELAEGQVLSKIAITLEVPLATHGVAFARATF